MGSELGLETSVVLLNLVCEDRRGRHKDHLDIGCLLDILCCEPRELLLLISILFHLAHPAVGVEETLLLSHGHVHGFLAEEAEDGCRGFSRA